MRPSFHPRLVNGPFDDPALFIAMAHSRRAILFDLGDLAALAPGDILKTSHVFVTHAHMDHFVGFDRMLRLMLGRDKHLHLFGPSGFLDRVGAKLAAYTWNLVGNYAEGLTVTAVEIGEKKRTYRHFECRSGFMPSADESAPQNDAIILEEPGFAVRTTLLDHHIACLAFAIEEKFHVNILKPALDELGLQVGPWLNRFKGLIFSQADPATPVHAPAGQPPGGERTFSLSFLAERIARITPGQKVAYVADAVYSPSNEAKIMDLAAGADHLFIEAAFLEAERETAKAKYHLTARQAGSIARKAGVAEMTIFHHSPRYKGRQDVLRQEAYGAFSGRLP
jgi:ribonuclease Z